MWRPGCILVCTRRRPYSGFPPSGASSSPRVGSIPWLTPTWIVLRVPPSSLASDVPCCCAARSHSAASRPALAMWWRRMWVTCCANVWGDGSGRPSIGGRRKGSRTDQAVSVVSSLYSGARVTGASPQPSRPSAWTRTSRQAFISSRPNEVSNGARYFISIWRSSIASIFIVSSGQHVVAPQPLAGAQEKIYRAVSPPEIVKKHLTGRHSPGVGQSPIALVDGQEVRGDLHEDDRVVEVEEGLPGRDPQGVRCCLQRGHGGIPGRLLQCSRDRSLDLGRTERPVYFQPVAVEAPVQLVGHGPIVVHVVPLRRRGQLAQVEARVDALQRIVGPHRVVVAHRQGGLALGALQPESDVLQLPPALHAGHVGVEERASFAPPGKAVAETDHRAVGLDGRQDGAARSCRGHQLMGGNNVTIRHPPDLHLEAFDLPERVY